MKKHVVCVITGTRAEYGLLRPLLLRIKDNNETELKLIVTGSHLSNSFGNTKNEIIEDGFDEFIEVPIPLEDDSDVGMAKTTGIAIGLYANVIKGINPELLVILGDRYEMLAAAVAAHFIGIPIAHMCGGDVTEGAVDDAIRHCITKMSYLHFAGCEQSLKRIIRMGEAPERVYNVGEPGVENCKSVDLLSRNELERQLEFPYVKNDYCVVTYHPVTMEKNSVNFQISELVSALDSIEGMAYIITKANADSGGRRINFLLEKEAALRENWLLVDSLGMLKYLSSVKYAKLVIGNSSSGLIEVPALGVPTINIGDRQKGRMMAKSVICCSAEANAIELAIRHGLSEEFRKDISYEDLPFGNGTTSSKVFDVIIRYLRAGDFSNKKTFYDN